jgi:hypothetical protein
VSWLVRKVMPLADQPTNRKSLLLLEELVQRHPG